MSGDSPVMQVRQGGEGAQIGVVGRVLPVVDHHIATAPIGFDEILDAHGLQLLADFADEDIDDFRVRLVQPAIEMVENGFLAQDHAFPQSENFSDLILFFGQRNRFALRVDLFGIHVDFDRADAQRVLLKAAAAPDQVLNFHENFFMGEGVDNEVVGTGLQDAETGGFVHGAGDGDDGGAYASETKFSDDIKIAESFFRKAKQNDIVIIKLYEVECFFGVVRFVDDGKA